MWCASRCYPFSTKGHPLCLALRLPGGCGGKPPSGPDWSGPGLPPPGIGHSHWEIHDKKRPGHVSREALRDPGSGNGLPVGRSAASIRRPANRPAARWSGPSPPRTADRGPLKCHRHRQTLSFPLLLPAGTDIYASVRVGREQGRGRGHLSHKTAVRTCRAVRLGGAEQLYARGLWIEPDPWPHKAILMRKIRNI